MEGQKNDLEYLQTWSWMRLMGFSMAIRAAVQLNVFNIIANSGDDVHLSAAEIVSHIPAVTHPSSAIVLDRILRNLAANSFLSSYLRQNPKGQETCIPRQPDSSTVHHVATWSGHDGNLTLSDTPLQQLGQSVTEDASSDYNSNIKNVQFSSCALPDSLPVTRVYGLMKESRCLVSDATDLSLAPAFLFSTEREVVDGMYKLKEAVLDPDCLVSGESFFDRLSEKPEMSSLFNEVMANSSRIFFREVLEVYGGFKGLEELMDVGGGVGTSLGKIVSKYPRIRGINFDMPHVIAEAPNYPRVDHVAGDMFDFLPKAETIILKWILHDWDDEKCKKLLGNCWKALPEDGKVIVLEFAIPEKLENEYTTWNVIAMDFVMMTLNPGGKERTVAEFQALAMASGFVETKVCVTTKGIHVMELLKKSS